MSVSTGERLQPNAEAPPVYRRIVLPAARWWRPFVATLGLLDTVAMTSAIAVAHVLLSGDPGFVQGRLRLSTELPVLASMVPAWVLTLAVSGAYQRRSLGSSDEYRRVFDAALHFLVLVAAAAFLLRLDVERGILLLAVPLGAGASLSLRFLLRGALHRRRTKGRFVRNVLVVGFEGDSTELIRCMQRAPHAGLRPVAACVPESTDVLRLEGVEVPVLAGPDHVIEAVIMSQADAVAIADSVVMSNAALRRLAWQLEGTGVELMVTPSMTDLAGPRISIRPVSDLPLLHVEEPQLKATHRVAKGTVDRLVAAGGLLVLSPVLLVLAVLVRLTSRGPIFFRQERVGLAGRPFTIYKFRTMSRDAEERLADLFHLNEHDGVLFKMRYDPRVTRLGKTLRRWSLDELPQLWNVLRGDMSIVGPRPPLPSEVQKYTHEVRRRLLVRPGLTGLWQVSGRAGLSWEETVRLDLFYVENWSLTLDAVIVLRTLSAVLKRQGAC